MKPPTGRRLIALAIGVQLLAAATWAVLPKFGSGPPGGAYAFRAEQRIAALSEWLQHPTPDTKATWEEELARLKRHNLMTRHMPLLAAVLLFNGIIIYALRDYRATRAMA